jgi:UDP-MurNAc hydroxylase
VKVTVIGHAGLLVETDRGSIVCDPWFVPAFFGSWFPFPRNDRLAPEVMDAIEQADYLYISHRHGDHFDEAFLRDHIRRDITVLLPDFPTSELAGELAALGFTRTVQTRSGEPVDLDGLEVMIVTETAIADGPQGDSAIVIGDGRHRLLNQNDCRPHSAEQLLALGPIDLQFLQFSGAIWYPMVYELDAAERHRLGVAKRQAQLRRAVQYVKMIDAPVVAPSAGPPCFLDHDLIHLNDTDDDPANIFPDQRVFLDQLESEGITSGVMNVPGTVIELDGPSVQVHQPPDHDRALTHKREELAAYAADWAPWLEAERATWLAPRPDLVERLAGWFEPLLALCPRLRAGVGTGVVIRSGDTDVLIDFPAGTVVPFTGQDHGFRFDIARPLLETVIERKAVDWSNAFFLSCRFTAWRAGDYNEYVYNFFKSLSPERITRAEAEAIAALGVDPDAEVIELCGYEMERFCPHRRADLTTFGTVADGVLTCELHGWRFDLATGRCLTSSAARPLQVRPAATT